MRPCCRSVWRRRWARWWGQRRRGCWRCRSRLGSVCFWSCWRRRSRGPSGRRGSGTPTAPRSATAMRTVRWTLGGRRVQVRRPRARTADGDSEVPLKTYEHFADRDPLQEVVLERMLAGVSTRRYRRAQEPVGPEVEAEARSTSKSASGRIPVRPWGWGEEPARPDVSDSGRAERRPAHPRGASFGHRAAARSATCRLARSHREPAIELLLRRFEPGAVGACRGRFVAVAGRGQRCSGRFCNRPSNRQRPSPPRGGDLQGPCPPRLEPAADLSALEGGSRVCSSVVVWHQPHSGG
jgi:hypothetical protein